MSNIFKEVDDALKQEKLENFWKQNGTFIILMIIMLILGTALHSAYNYYQQSVQQKHTAELLALNDAPATTPPSVPADLSGNQAALARFTVARAFLDKGEAKNAYDAYLAVTNADDVSDELRALAAYYAISIAATPELDINIKDLSYPRGTVWQPYLDLLEAVRLVEEDKNYDATLKILDNLKEVGGHLPQSFNARVYQLREIYTYDRPAAEATKEETK